MSKYLELPWSVDDTIENLKELKEGLQERCIIRNLHGRGEKDAEEIAFDFDRAIKALEEIQQYQEIGLTPQMVLDLIKSEKQAHKIALENADKLDAYRAIGTVEECRVAAEKMKPKKPIDRCMFSECPTCGNVEIQFCKHCPDCGQALIW